MVLPLMEEYAGCNRKNGLVNKSITEIFETKSVTAHLIVTL
jgi:hypothetical protein